MIVLPEALITSIIPFKEYRPYLVHHARYRQAGWDFRIVERHQRFARSVGVNSTMLQFRTADLEKKYPGSSSLLH